MRSFWSDPYLWIHLAGLAALPLFLGLCLLGFSVGDPFLPTWLELLLVMAIGIAPIFWMQWQRPFYIFSLVAVALKPEQLTEDQRRLLTLFKSQRNRVLAGLVPVLLLFILVKIYGLSSIATSVFPFPVQWRGAGLLLAAIAFLGSNLFTQVPVSVLSVMLINEPAFSTTPPYPLEQIGQNFSVLGFKVNQILPPVLPEVQPPPVVAATATEGVAETTVAPSSQFGAETASPPLPEAETSLNNPADASPESADLGASFVTAAESASTPIDPIPSTPAPESPAETSEALTRSETDIAQEVTELDPSPESPSGEPAATDDDVW